MPAWLQAPLHAPRRGRASKPVASNSVRLGMVVARVPERDRCSGLVCHPVRVADQLDIYSERVLEVVDRLAGCWPVRQRDGAEQLRSRFRLKVLDAFVDVANVEGDVVAAPVGVRTECLVLVR